MRLRVLVDIVSFLRNRDCKETKFVQKHKLGQNTNCDKKTNCDKTQIVTKHKLQGNTNCDNTQTLRIRKL